MRLFVAVDLPEGVKESLDAAVAPLRAAHPAARWVRPVAYHLTLAFLGDVEPASVAAISQALRRRLEGAGGFHAHFGALGSFPNAGPVRVLWVGLEPSARFVRLAELVQDGLRAAGGSSDDKPFRSHVTLARCTPPWPSHDREVLAQESLSLREGGVESPFACDRVTLFSSRTQPSSGMAYRVEEAIALSSS